MGYKASDLIEDGFVHVVAHVVAAFGTLILFGVSGHVLSNGAKSLILAANPGS
jgi:hypothetical protein